MTLTDSGDKFNDMENNLNDSAPKKSRKEANNHYHHHFFGADYNVQDTVTSQFSVGSIRLNLGKAPPRKKRGILPDGGRLIAILYALMLILFGMAFPVKEALQAKWLTTYPEAVFLAYLYGMAFISILYIEIYLVQKARKHGHETKSGKDKPQILVRDKNTSAEGTYDTITGKFTYQQQQKAIKPRDPGVEVYILEQGSEEEAPLPHHTSLYIRFGAIIFGLGNMVYDGLLLNQIQTRDNNHSNCLHESFVWPHYMHLGFLLTQTYFIFKHPQVHITFTKPLARLSFMHMFATNVCVWFRTVIRETLEGFLHYSAKTGDHGSTANDHVSDYVNNVINGTEHHDYGHSVNTSGDSHAGGCGVAADLLLKASPYLFPCVLEYSLLAAAVMFSMYSDVGSVTRGAGAISSSQTKINHITEINFHHSHKGMFAGVVVVAATCVSIVLFFSYSEFSMIAAELIYLITMISLYGLVLLVTCIAFIQLQRLKFNRLAKKTVDDVMLIASMAGLVLFMILKILPIMSVVQERDIRTILSFTASLLALVVGFVQTAVIIDGMRRFTHSEALYDVKPGRGAIMFLLCNNVALWLFRTFHMKEVEHASYEQEHMYGYLAWQLMLHALVPLLIFYHFHCSACLAHIWSTSYTRPKMKDQIDPEITCQSQVQSLNNSFSEDYPGTAYQNKDDKKRSDLVPDRIIEFRRHGKAPRAESKSVHTVVESIDSPMDTGNKDKPVFPVLSIEDKNN